MQRKSTLGKWLANTAALITVIAGSLVATSTPAAAVSRSSIVSMATSELNNSSRNHESPAGSGCNYYTGYFRTWKPADGCPSTDGVQWRDSDWCADFSKYVWQKAGVTYADLAEDPDMPWRLSGWASSFKDYGEKYGTWHSRGSGYTPQPGDAITFDWGNDGSIGHVGIVTSATSSTVYTIEGNSGNVTQTNSYSRDNVEIEGYTVPVGAASDEPMIGNSVTGDSYADLLAVDASGKMMLYSNNFVRDDGQPFTGSTPREVAHGWSSSTRIIPADVTGDGFTDLLAVDASGKMMLYSNNFVRDDGQPFTGSTPREVAHGWSSST
ncbi:CHAP domain-containing protein, partial [Nonomuraea sp. NPDC049141]|uniref:CHAP domain-containing protein n=1 Tax=Nonomuraea sp. NPDC049141 TaxID=3155500 RepID=UPI0033CAFDD5